MTRGNGDIPDAFLRAFSVSNQGDSDAEIHDPHFAPIATPDDNEPGGEYWVGIIARFWHGDALRRFTTASAMFYGSDPADSLEHFAEIGLVPTLDTVGESVEWLPVESLYPSYRKQYSFNCANPACGDAWHAEVTVEFVKLGEREK